MKQHEKKYEKGKREEKGMENERQVPSVAFLISGSSLTLISHFSSFSQFSKRLSDFKHSYLSKITTKNEIKYIKI